MCFSLTTHDKLVFFLKWREGVEQCVCVSRIIKWCVLLTKNTKVSERGRSFTIEGFGKFGKVVLARLVLRNAIRVRFLEVWR